MSLYSADRDLVGDGGTGSLGAGSFDRTVDGVGGSSDICCFSTESDSSLSTLIVYELLAPRDVLRVALIKKPLFASFFTAAIQAERDKPASPANVSYDGKAYG